MLSSAQMKAGKMEDNSCAALGARRGPQGHWCADADASQSRALSGQGGEEWAGGEEGTRPPPHRCTCHEAVLQSRETTGGSPPQWRGTAPPEETSTTYVLKYRKDMQMVPPQQVVTSRAAGGHTKEEMYGQHAGEDAAAAGASTVLLPVPSGP